MTSARWAGRLEPAGEPRRRDDPRADLVARRTASSCSAPTATGATSPFDCSTAAVNSLKVGIGSALICVLFAVILALLAGYYGGWADWVITRFFDLIWAFPVILLSIALGSALAINGFHHFGINLEGDSLWIPTLVISYVLIPYVGRPLARADPVAAREGVRRGVDRAGRVELSRDVRGDPAEHRLVDARLLRADHREQHPARGGAVVPRCRHPGPEAVVGQADRGRADPHHDRALADARSRASPSS